MYSGYSGICPTCKTNHNLTESEENPHWLNDPIPTPAGTVGEVGSCTWFRAMLSQLQYYWKFIALRFGVTIPAGVLETPRMDGMHRYQLVELRLVAEACMQAAGLSISDYFSYDKYGNFYQSTQTDWTDVDRTAGTPNLPRKMDLRAIHIEELRRGVPFLLRFISRASNYGGTQVINYANVPVGFASISGISGDSGHPMGILQQNASAFNFNISSLSPQNRTSLFMDSVFGAVYAIGSSIARLNGWTGGLMHYYWGYEEPIAVSGFDGSIGALYYEGTCLGREVQSGSSTGLLSWYEWFTSIGYLAYEGYSGWSGSGTPPNIPYESRYSLPHAIYKTTAPRSFKLGDTPEVVPDNFEISTPTGVNWDKLLDAPRAELRVKVGSTYFDVLDDLSSVDGNAKYVKLSGDGATLTFGDGVHGAKPAALSAIYFYLSPWAMMANVLDNPVKVSPEDLYRYVKPQYSTQQGLVYLKLPPYMEGRFVAKNATVDPDSNTTSTTYAYEKYFGNQTSQSAVVPIKSVNRSIIGVPTLDGEDFTITQAGAADVNTAPTVGGGQQFAIFRFNKSTSYRQILPGPYKRILSVGSWTNIGPTSWSGGQSVYVRYTHCTWRSSDTDVIPILFVDPDLTSSATLNGLAGSKAGSTWSFHFTVPPAEGASYDWTWWCGELSVSIRELCITPPSGNPTIPSASIQFTEELRAAGGTTTARANYLKFLSDVYGYTPQTSIIRTITYL